MWGSELGTFGPIGQALRVTTLVRPELVPDLVETTIDDHRQL